MPLVAGAIRNERAVVLLPGNPQRGAQSRESPTATTSSTHPRPGCPSLDADSNGGDGDIPGAGQLRPAP